MENHVDPASIQGSSEQNINGTGLVVLLTVSLFALLAEAILFLPFLLINNFIVWAIVFACLLSITRLNANTMTSYRLSIFGACAGIIVGLSPITFLHIATVSQLFVIPSVLLVLSACSIALLRHCIAAAAYFISTALLSFTLAMSMLDNTLPTIWPVSWLILGALIIWVGRYTSRQPS